MKVRKAEEVEWENLKEENKGFKSWIKRHKTVLSVGATALVGVGLSVVAHRIGYGKGHYEGYDNGFKDACNFNEAEYYRSVNGEI